MTILSRDELLDRAAPKYEVIPVPEWGGDVRVRSLPAETRENFFSDLVDKTTGKIDYKVVRLGLTALCIVDENNEPFLSRAELAQMDFRGVERIVAAAERLNAITEEKIEAEVKN